jgi:hypothetical protein
MLREDARLVDFLRLFMSDLHDTEWQVSDLECTIGEPAEELEAFEKNGARVPGLELLNIAERLVQVIDGRFVGTGVRPFNPGSEYWHGTAPPLT